MNIKLLKPKNKFLEKTANDFMKDSRNSEMAEYIFRDRVEEAKARAYKQNKQISQESVIDYARRHGFLKTETDRKIVEGIIIKEKIKKNLDKYKENIRKKIEYQKKVNQFL